MSSPQCRCHDQETSEKLKLSTIWPKPPPKSQLKSPGGSKKEEIPQFETFFRGFHDVTQTAAAEQPNFLQLLLGDAALRVFHTLLDATRANLGLSLAE